MQKRPNDTPANRRYLWLVALIALPVIAWAGLLDQYSAQSLGNSLSSAGVIYATARGINALVSLLQGTELHLLIATFSVGELLDPVNDLIERFSQLILVALGSLALQKILLGVVSDALFNVLLSGAALCAGASLWLGHAKSTGPLLKVFLLMVFLRFSLSLVVLANAWVDARFLGPADAARHQAMETFRGDLREVENFSHAKDQLPPDGSGKLQRDFDAYRLERNELARTQAALTQTLQVERAKLDELVDKAGGLCTRWKYPATCPAEVEQAKQAYRALEEKRIHYENHAAELAVKMAALQSDIDCLTARERGENCTLWDNLKTPPTLAEVREKLEDINAKVSDFSENTINLLVSLLLKTVAIPLVFIYLLLLVVRRGWSKL